MKLDVTVGSDNRVVDVDVLGFDGGVKANVYVEILRGRVTLVVTPAIESRDSDEAMYMIDLLTGKITNQAGELV